MSETENPFKTITVGKTSYLALPMPLEPALNAFDVLIQTYGEALIRYVLVAVKQQKGVAAPQAKEDFNQAVVRLQKGLREGDTLRVVRAILNPEYIKHDGKNLDLNVVYAKRGFQHVFSLFLQVANLNYADFLVSGPPAR